MPAETPKQRRFFSLVRAAQEGKLPKGIRKRKSILAAARSVTKQEAKEFARKPGRTVMTRA